MTGTQLQDDETIPFYPDHVRTEFQVLVGILVIVLLIGVAGLINPIGLGEPADPMNTPAHVKPEWYFLALYQVLKFIPKTTGALLPVLFIGIIVLWPFIDRKRDASSKAQRYRLAFSVVGLIIMVALTIWAEMS